MFSSFLSFFCPCLLSVFPFPEWACLIGCGHGFVSPCLNIFQSTCWSSVPELICCSHISLLFYQVLSNFFCAAKMKTDSPWFNFDLIKKQQCCSQKRWRQYSSWISSFLFWQISHFLCHSKKKPKKKTSTLFCWQAFYFLLLDFPHKATSISCVRSLVKKIIFDKNFFLTNVATLRRWRLTYDPMCLA